MKWQQIADYPGSQYEVGKVIEIFDGDNTVTRQQKEFYNKYPHIFRPVFSASTSPVSEPSISELADTNKDLREIANNVIADRNQYREAFEKLQSQLTAKEAELKEAFLLYHNQVTTIAKRDGEIEKLKQILEDCEEYFDNKADAEYDYDQERNVGNKEMNLLAEIRNALKK